MVQNVACFVEFETEKEIISERTVFQKIYEKSIDSTKFDCDHD